jgi:hypothetical protein
LSEDALRAGQSKPSPVPLVKACFRRAAARNPPGVLHSNLGETIQQIIAIKGQPKEIVDIGAKETYVYPDMKIVFVNGKVSDVR